MTDSPTRSLPTIGSPAPEFEAESTHGPISLDSAAFEGKWIVLFSHPYDFTPVCSTEFIAFANATDDFAAMNTQLIGLSVDSKFSHIAWMRSLERDHGIQVKFPVIADLDQKVGQAYGMVHPGASSMATVRAVFVIDPKRIVRALVYYPMNAGRSIEEIKRITKALQFADAHPGTACPEGWCPGDDIILPPPGTTDEAKARLVEEEGNPGAKDWYFVKKQV